MTMPIHERKRQAAIKRHIRALDQDRRKVWRRFKTAVKDELIGSPYYDAYWHRAVAEETELIRQVQLARMDTPPNLIWNPRLKCLERIASRS